jgi:hypothetical protein
MGPERLPELVQAADWDRKSIVASAAPQRRHSTQVARILRPCLSSSSDHARFVMMRGIRGETGGTAAASNRRLV